MRRLLAGVLKIIAVLSLLFVLAGCKGGPDNFSSYVQSRNVLGSYHLGVTNGTGAPGTARCTVTALDDSGNAIGSDTVTVGPIQTGDTEFYDGKIAIAGEEFASDYASECTAA